MSATSRSVSRKITFAGQPVPELPVADVERAQQHYRDTLGFDIAWLEPGQEIGAVSCPPVAIFFRRRTPPFEPALHWVYAEHIDATYQELISSGANIVDPLERKPWGLRQFTIEDLDGNRFYFHNDDAPVGQAATESGQAAAEPSQSASESTAKALRDQTTQTTPVPILHSIEPQLFVANIQRSCDFYTHKLGFSVAFLYGDPPHYGQVVRDNARINLRLVCEPVFAGGVRRREHLLSASITVATASELQHLFRSYQVAEVCFHQRLKTEPWGATTFIVSDPDENLILFAGPRAD
ncbi:VOC family protein [Granulicella sibirica]|uniref:VOC domain-containing protein n=1 Tax=Granulicella sibirica TaxID=2479048 RepID=A0A4V1L698_9BACT|nr:VOC family protein [Granulicella sibirica]RXH58514.1 hypothetical protein GRAN_1824 [Granulicella sibirica]